ncbi:hypothetical protein RN001_003399 [Aquatica leii]|uniref:Uncharacterized protein n=1 Tax=Aquatica leii TaxID=1421715 RepID=A0AAN7SRK7_9COLE|nr:hypothetical protein RN001_003399 [Aquatica leii]
MLTSSAENKNTFPTPFKNAFYWPESTVKTKIDKTAGTNKKSKIYPTVATSDEFIEHQRRVKKEKEEKDTEKRERIRIRKEKIKNKLVKRTNVNQNNNKDNNCDNNKENMREYSKDDFVIVRYDHQYFPGRVLEQCSDGLKVKTMAESGNFWKWPNKDDILDYVFADVICKIKIPTPVTKRGAYNIPEIDDLKKH